MPETTVQIDGTMVLVGAGVLAAGAIWWARSSLFDLGDSVNPTSRENVVYKGVNRIGKDVSGDEHFSLGVWFWELTHPGQLEREREMFEDDGDEDGATTYALPDEPTFTREPLPEHGTGTRIIDTPPVLY